MKTRTIAFLVLSLVVLSAIYYFDYRAKVDREERQLARERLIETALDGADTVTVKNAKGAYTLEKRPDPAKPGSSVWWIVQPIQEKADQTLVVNRILKELDGAKRFNRLDASDEEIAAYGLAKPETSLQIQAQGKTLASLILGKPTALKNESYIADATNPNTVWITSSAVRSVFERSLSQVRDKTVLPFPLKRLTQITLHSSAAEVAPVTIAKRPDGAWFLYDGEKVPAPDAPPTTGTCRVDTRILSTVFDLFLAMPVNDEVTTAQLTAMPLTKDTPRFDLTFAYLEPASNGQTTRTAQAQLQFYPAPVSATAAGDYCAFEPQRGLLFKSGEKFQTIMKQRFRVLRDVRLVGMTADSVCWLQIESRKRGMDRVAAFEREPGGAWHCTSDPSLKVHQGKVLEYLTLCLEGVRVVTEKPEPEPADLVAAGLESPDIRITLANKDRSIRDGFEIGLTYDQAKNLAYAWRIFGTGKRSTDAPIVAIGAANELREKLVQDERYFLFRPILDFETEKVGRIEVLVRATDGTTGSLSLTRAEGGPSSWKGHLSKQTDRNVPNDTAQFLLNTLSSVEYLLPAGIEAEKAAKEAGLDKPELEIRVYDRQGQLLCGLARGPYTEERKTLLIKRAQGDYVHVATQSVFGPIDVALRRLEAGLQ
ncbi:MAG TPA: DUF4340 domain-containing protein [Candidatus Sumerlaeota bacterium]|nr:DUF4340 domain-containing protein [Candidatus Sumerlaeota bacterium]HPS02066.1 DUF4340 domain-containing protein [Candidatus Sumerlaeota bacterium]